MERGEVGAGIVLDVVGEVVDGEALLTLVAIGDAISFFAEAKTQIILSAFMDGVVTWKPVEWDVREAEVVLWRREDAAKPIVRTLRTCAREVVAAR